MSSLYLTNFYAWTQEQTNLLRQGKVNYIDVINLIEEIESLGRQQKQELKNCGSLGSTVGNAKQKA